SHYISGYPGRDRSRLPLDETGILGASLLLANHRRLRDRRGGGAGGYAGFFADAEDPQVRGQLDAFYFWHHGGGGRGGKSGVALGRSGGVALALGTGVQHAQFRGGGPGRVVGRVAGVRAWHRRFPWGREACSRLEPFVRICSPPDG